MICRVAQSTRHSLTFVYIRVHDRLGFCLSPYPWYGTIPIFLSTLLKRCNVNKSVSRKISITHETTVGYGTILGCRAAAGVLYHTSSGMVPTIHRVQHRT